MKEHQTQTRTASLRGRTKRTLIAVIAIILTLALSTTAFADNGKGGGRPDGQSTGTKTQPGGDDTQNGTGASGKTDKQTGKRNTNMEGLNIDKIEEAIAALTDEDAKATLTTLLSAYVDAWTAKQDAVSEKDSDRLSTLSAALSAAKTTLDTALEAAGISTDTLYGVPEEAKDGTGKTNNRPTLDTDEIEAAIATLADTDANKGTLTQLLANYQAAIAAQNAGETSSLSESERAALINAVQNAENALLEAARNAGVIGGNGRGQFVSGYAYGNAEMDIDAMTAQISALDDTNENKTKLNELLTAYQNALLAQQNADQSALSEAEREALQQATDAAADALKEAMENAGLDTQIQNRAQEQKDFGFQIVTGDGTSEDGDGGVITSFFDWLKSLFE